MSEDSQPEHRTGPSGLPTVVVALAIALLLALQLQLLPANAWAGGYTPEEARARMALPEGFTAGVYASEPMIRQPLSANFDERGRLWVIEYLQYPVPAGLKPVTVDQYLRTEYDRVPDPPPRGPRGVDRIKILEDTDGDGRADKATVFVEGLNLASGLAVGHGGVFIGQAPYLLFYPDKNHDDVPDGDPEVLLAGFGLQDAHSTVNSLTWGPDGWLYGAQGSTVTARIRGVEFQQGIWRYHPKTKAFELFAEGGGNTWGLDFDRVGNSFGSSNGHFITFHMVQGGYYWKGFAKHGPLHNPNTFGYFDALAYDSQKRGGHVTPGGIIYKGEAFPGSFRGAFIGGNLLANAVYWHELEPLGSTFKAKFGGTLIDSRDTWFRPIDLTTGPDGAVYVVDWYDKRASHLDPRDNWDKTNGRIYRISYRGTKPAGPLDLAKKTTAELVALRKEPNDWYVDTARRLLAERRDASVVPQLKELLAADDDPALAMRDLWALDACGGLDDQTALGLLDHRVAPVRKWTIRRLGDDHRMNDSIRNRLLEIAASEPDAQVRSQLASSCQRWEPGVALAIVAKQARRNEDARDPHIPLLLWWAIEKQAHADPDGVVSLLADPDAQRAPIVRQQLLERAARLFASQGSESSFQACARLLAAAAGAEQVDRVIAGMEKGLEGRRLESVPPALQEPLERLWKRPDPSPALIKFAVRLGSEPALATALDLASNAKTRESDRVAFIELIGQVATPQAKHTLLELLARDESRAVHSATLNALGRFAGPEVGQAILDRYAGLAPAVRDRALDLLCSRRAWASLLADAIEARRLNAKDVRPAQALQVGQLGDPALAARFERIWGKLPGPNSAEKAKRIAEVRGMLPEGDKGSALRGKKVFQDTCAGCHKLFSEGKDIGPDLTGAERGNLEFLLSSVIDPSALVRKEYQAQTIATKDGRVLSGLVVEETEKTLTLFDSKQQKTVLPREAIEAMKPAATSLMPDGVLDPLSEDQIRDLFRYLQSSGLSR